MAESDNQEREPRRWFPKSIKPAEWIMIAFTAVTAFAAVGAVLVAQGQLREMKAAAPDTHKLVQANSDMARAAKTQAENTGKLVDAANKSAVAAQDAAGTAKSLYDLTRENTVRQYSAKFDINYPRLTNTGVGETPRVHIPVRPGSAANNGYWLSGFSVLAPSDGVIQNKSCAEIAKDKKVSRWFLTDAAEMEKVAPFTLTQLQIDNIKSSAQAILFTARICYDDGFGHNPHRDVCIQWFGDNWNSSSGGVFCQIGNGTGP